MPVNITGARPLSTISEALNVALIADPPVENDADDTITTRVYSQNVTPAAVTVAIVTTNGLAQITGADLSQLRVGDTVAGTNISGTVSAVDTSVTPHAATISANATVAGADTITVTPASTAAFNLAIYDIVAKHAMPAGGSTLCIDIEIYTYDGSGAIDSDADGKDNAANGYLAHTATLKLDMDSILSKARVPRS
ncbi:MAG: hypothetical protein QNJ46_07920 [Leptolyngbyaceae cyanobacterium MO_188.B28]|nr:hypothetical protein [Leptolyngbyaceae cyanobacterium MO_188.B28]